MDYKSSDSNKIDPDFGSIYGDRKMSLKSPQNTHRIAAKRFSMAHHYQ